MLREHEHERRFFSYWLFAFYENR